MHPWNRYKWDTLPYFAIGEPDCREWKTGGERSTCEEKGIFHLCNLLSDLSFFWMIQPYLKWVTILERGGLERSIWWVECCEGQSLKILSFSRQFFSIKFLRLINCNLGLILFKIWSNSKKVFRICEPEFDKFFTFLIWVLALYFLLSVLKLKMFL